MCIFTKKQTIKKKEFANDRVYAELMANMADAQDGGVTIFRCHRKLLRD